MIKNNRTLFEFTLKGNKLKGDSNIITQSLNDLNLLINSVKNSNTIFINDFVIQSLTYNTNSEATLITVLSGFKGF